MKVNKGTFQLSVISVAIASATGFFVPSVVQAEEYTTTQEKMVVVSSRTPKAISEIPGTVWYVDAEQIEQEYRGGKSLDEILAATVPSLDVSSGGRTHAGQNLRGRSIMVMIDGVSLQSVRSISRQLDSIDPFNIERIEVLSGASSIYGAGASGGVINIVTKKALGGEIEFETYVGGTSGFNGSEDFDYKLAQSIAGGNEKVQGRASVAYTSTQGYYDANGDMVTPDITQGSTQFNETIDLMGNLQVNLADNQNLQLLAQYYDSQQDTPYGLYFEKDADGKYQFVDVRDGYAADRQQGTERVMLSAAYNHSDFLSHQLIAELSYRSEEHTFMPYTSAGRTTLATSSSSQNTDIISLKAALNKSFDALSLTYGIDGFVDSFDSDNALYNQSVTEGSGGLINQIESMAGRYPGIDTQAFAGFLQAEYALTDNWTLQGGYRYQYMNTEVSDFQKSSNSDFVPGGETDYSEGLFNVGTVYHLTENSQVWANFSQGFDLANPAKYYGKDATVNVNDTKLEGIKTDSYELGYRYDFDKLSFQTAAYHSYSDGSVEYADDQSIKGISNPIRVYGAEAQISYWVMANLQLGASGHYVVSEEKGDNGWEDYDAREASTSKASTWIGWYEADYSVKLQSLTAFDYEDANALKLEGYTVVDMIGTYQLPVGTIGFGVKNLFNEDYLTTWSQRATQWYSGGPDMYQYQGRGRTYTLNYQVKY
ncbi:TonB-dependent receptor [Vibrio genomosp. F10]|uniref:Aerobactin siderophore receptor iutA n=1 Tax=Vibrio genomosp. F10 TaxID=723171 RepID=A0A1B9QXP4_9VIBR|nr:TonB-dependent receptor [Vibrio genomosp. F10]OCH75006.1 aerobactin siderophore receptor iutA [Vibrio genomosp. F10]OEF03958.1 aerobactin siderophore receptor iutA [Vibrio genomosp. F10 str. 9ZB36]